MGLQQDTDNSIDEGRKQQDSFKENGKKEHLWSESGRIKFLGQNEKRGIGNLILKGHIKDKTNRRKQEACVIGWWNGISEHCQSVKKTVKGQQE